MREVPQRNSVDVSARLLASWYACELRLRAVRRNVSRVLLHCCPSPPCVRLAETMIVCAGSRRRKHHLSFRTADATWVGGAVGVGAPTAKSLNALARGASPAVGGFDIARFLGQLTPEQRCVIGFPAVGDPYWCKETLAGVQERYSGAVDLRPYADAAGLPPPSTSARL